MQKRQLTALFACNICPFTIGSGVLPMLPGYAADLGAPQSVVGLYLAFCYAAVAVGALTAVWLGRVLGGYRRVLLACAALAVPVTLALGYVPGIWVLAVLTAALWFAGGTGLALVNVMAGISAGPEERGKVFGVLALASPVGALLGGLAAGPIVERWGYGAMFAAMAGVAVLWFVASRTVVEAEPSPQQEDEGGAVAPRARLDRRFHLLFAAQILSAISAFVGVLSRLLVMGNLGLSATAISMTGAITGAITLPVSPLAGLLSDRIGRRLLVVLGYALGVVSLLLLIGSTVPWHFWVAATVAGAAMSLTSAVSPAFAADVLPREALDRGMSLISATGWIGAIAGMGSTGYAIERFGPVPAFVGGAMLPLASIVLLYMIPVPARSTVAAAEA